MIHENMRIYRGGYSDNISWLSSLRGFAALLVFFSHLTILPISVNILFVIGRIGVACFFLMTGYLTIESRKKRNPKQYIVNRFLRIYPIYWMVLVLKVIICFGKWSIKEIILNGVSQEVG